MPVSYRKIVLVAKEHFPPAEEGRTKAENSLSHRQLYPIKTSVYSLSHSQPL